MLKESDSLMRVSGRNEVDLLFEKGVMKATFRESRSSLAIIRRARCLQARPNQRPQRRLRGDPSAYAYNYPIDVEHAIVVDVGGTPARTYDEVASTKTMLERTEQRLDLRLGWLAADATCGIGRNACMAVGQKHHTAYPRLGKISIS
jgi:hypothetical protein